MAFGVFISYSKEDKDIADQIFYSLQRIVEISPFMAEYFPQAGIDLKQKISNDLDKSSFVIVLLTQSGVASQWVNQEIGYARARQLLIVPVVEEGTEVQGFLEGIEFIKLEKNNPKEVISKIIYNLRLHIPRGHEIYVLHLRLSCSKCRDPLGYKFSFVIPMPIHPHINEVKKQGIAFAARCPKCNEEMHFDPFTFEEQT